MQAFSGAAVTTDTAFETRRAVFDALAAALQARRDEASAGGNERARKLHQSRGQMLPRERIAALLDAGSPFFEIGQLTAADLYDGVPPGATLITGVGRVAGRDCMLIVNDPTVKGGTMFGMTTKRHVRAQMFAWQHRLPCITMVQSGGAFLPDLANIFPDDGQGGSVMYNQVKMSSEGIAQIALVFGPSTAGGAYIPALCDELVIVRNQGAMFLGSPQLVYAATGEVVDSEALGGALMHCSVSGVADHLADDDAHALAIARRIVRHLGEPAPLRWTRAVPEEPRHPAAELRGLVRLNGEPAADTRELIVRLVDSSRFQEFKPLHGQTLVCGFARIEGFEVGIVSGAGALTAQAAAKGAHFIELCGQRDIPLVFLVDSPGFADSGEPSQGSTGRHGAKLLNAAANADVPKITVIVGQAHGAAYHALCGRAFRPNALLMWPNARAAASPDAPDDEAGALNWARQLWCDAVIEPEQTRGVLALLLDAAGRTPARPSGWGVFRM
ncbi:MAG: methylcrotonoyl-CoA carboxylase [Burkholderiales bacterium]|nr:methylcrotonoyl-CoA carboxylase [Burkholderiales bacterium]